MRITRTGILDTIFLIFSWLTSYTRPHASSDSKMTTTNPIPYLEPESRSDASTEDPESAGATIATERLTDFGSIAGRQARRKVHEPESPYGVNDITVTYSLPISIHICHWTCPFMGAPALHESTSPFLAFLALYFSPVPAYATKPPWWRLFLFWERCCAGGGECQWLF